MMTKFCVENIYNRSDV